MIVHLSAPPDSSINDGIDKEQFTLCYATIDDAVHMINRLGSGYFLAKIDPIAPISANRRQNCWAYVGGISTMWIAGFPLDFGSAPFIFNQYAEALEWIFRHNYLI